ncbi:MAG: hypothetical protein CL687_04835 [Candidatus Pelagibacter sp.]|nr:hypothetical protein [Candidatus Pelagibacter sp.]OUW23361.1 MAG: hypothetical protein CBD34_03230 [Rickettsiales bacterium TMED174]
MKNLNILVTGAGSGVGQSIIKALKISKIKCNVISADINHSNAALFRTRKSIIIPKVEDKGALKWFLKNLKINKIDILMIGSEFDMIFFSKHKDIIKKKTGCEVCISNLNVIKMADDKYATQEFLKKNNLPFLRTFIIRNQRDLKLLPKKLTLPFILKSRFGTSSRNLHLIKNMNELKYLIKKVPNPIIQEHIGTEKDMFENEYTCSYFKSKDKKIFGPFLAKRKLVNGTSWVVEIIRDEKISALVMKIAHLIDNQGTFNIQLKNRKNEPVPFEFNPRFSGTTSIRSHFGFNEPEMYIKNFIQKKTLKKPRIKKGISFRYIEEIFLDGVKRKNLKKNTGKGVINKWF